MGNVIFKRTAPQKSFMQLKCEYPAFVGGYGTGKSQVMCQSAIVDSLEGGAGSLVALYEPNYDLVNLIAAPRMELLLNEMGVRYKYNKSDKIIYTSSSSIGDFLFRSLSNPERIIGYEAFRSKIDELDTLSAANAQEVFEKIIARNRQVPDTYVDKSGKAINSVSIFTTPEGFRFVYQRWKQKKGIEPEDRHKYQIVQASTHSNPFLPASYIPNLRASYPPQLINAYLEGHFVNMKSGSVYAGFDRKLNKSFYGLDKARPLLIGMDFNVNPMSAVVAQLHGNELHVVDEIILPNSDTEQMAQEIISRYQHWHGKQMIEVFPDAAGNQRQTSAKNTDHQILKSYGINVVVDGSNPRVRDRINSVNARISDGIGNRFLFINPLCQTTIECLENQVYDDKGDPDKKEGFDHSNDALGYLIWQLFPISGEIFRQRNGR